MIRRSTIVWCGVAVAVGAGLIVVKHRVQELEDQLAMVNRDIAANREAMHVLGAEWSYLNRPDRMEDLGVRLLGFTPVSADRTVSPDELKEHLSLAAKAAAAAPAKTPPKPRPAVSGRTWAKQIMAGLGNKR